LKEKKRREEIKTLKFGGRNGLWEKRKGKLPHDKLQREKRETKRERDEMGSVGGVIREDVRELGGHR